MSAISNTFTLEELFDGRLFHVPDYQRTYAWESQHRTDLLEDLEILGATREHYTGTVVLYEPSPGDKKRGSDRYYREFDIVDGQQRLTTLVLLLDAIRRALAALPDDDARRLADGIKRTFIAAIDLAGQPLYKLALNNDSDHYFRSVAISDDPAPEAPQITGQHRLMEARLEFAAYLEEVKSAIGGGYKEWLFALHQKVAQQLRVTLYEVDSAGEVGVIFEVMNNRGKPLSELEKVKNYLLYAATTLTLDNELGDAVNAAGSTRRVTFSPSVALDDEAVEFLAIGHPLMDALVARAQARGYPGRASVRVIETSRWTPRNGWLLTFVLDFEGVVRAKEVFPVFVNDVGEADREFAAWLVERAAGVRFEDILGHDLPDRGPHFEEAVRLAQEVAAERLLERQAQLSSLNSERLEQERAKLERFYEYREKAAAEKLAATRETFERISLSEDTDVQRIIPVWAKNLEDAKRL